MAGGNHVLGARDINIVERAFSARRPGSGKRPDMEDRLDATARFRYGGLVAQVPDHRFRASVQQARYLVEIPSEQSHADFVLGEKPTGERPTNKTGPSCDKRSACHNRSFILPEAPDKGK